jgi:geranylgeranyl pyrophosphate synthase
MKAYETVTGKKHKRIISPALALELFHVSTLIHDDIMDEDAKRRKKASMHKLYEKHFLSGNKEKEYSGDIFSKESVRFGTSAAIVEGNMLFSLGAVLLESCGFSEAKRLAALRLYHDAYIKVNAGQMIDMMNEHRKISEEEYVDMASLKTGNLLAASLKLGALLGGASEKVQDDYYSYGMHLAIAFQLRDDELDITGKGNTPGSDISKGKQTIMMIHSRAQGSKAQKKILDSGNIKKTISVFEETGALSRNRELIEHHLSLAEKALPKDGFFSGLLSYIKERKE